MIFAGDLVGGSGYRGTSTVLSGTALVTVSASAILSGSAVLLTPHQGASMTDSGQDLVLGVDSVVDNTSFLVVTGAGINPTDDYPFTFLIVR